jgi:hypothetical protein
MATSLSSVIAVAGLVTCLSAEAVAAACLRADAGDQVATGVLTRGKIRHPIKNPTRPLILKVAKPLCLDAANPADNVRATRIIHVYPSRDGMELSRFLGKRVLVRGRAVRGMDIASEAPIGVEATAIEAR